VIIGKSFGGPQITKDGVTVANWVRRCIRKHGSPDG
jgi:hypothetical protein